MPIPFIAGAIVGAAAVALWSKRGELKSVDAECLAKAAGSAVEAGIKKVAGVGCCAAAAAGKAREKVGEKLGSKAGEKACCKGKSGGKDA